MAANAASWACDMRPRLYVDAVAVALVARRAQQWVSDPVTLAIDTGIT